MSVLLCSRVGCGNIMSDRYSDRYGYICRGCFNELVRLGVHTSVTEFMESMTPVVDEEASLAYFDKLFPLQESSNDK